MLASLQSATVVRYGTHNVAQKAHDRTQREIHPRTVRGGHLFDTSLQDPCASADESRQLSIPAFDLSPSEALIVAFIISAGLPHAQATELLKIVSNPAWRPDHVRWVSWQHWAEHMQRECMHGVNVMNMAVPSVDGDGEMMFVFRSAACAQNLAAFGATR